MANTFTLISATTLGSNASSFSFTSIPSTYTDLYVLASLRDGTGIGNQTPVRMTINADGSSIYSNTILTGGGSSTSGSRASNQPTMYTGSMNGTYTTTDSFSNLQIYIPNYTISQNRQISIAQYQENFDISTAMIVATGGLYRSTTTISSIEFQPNGRTFATNSSFYLYGIKNS